MDKTELKKLIHERVNDLNSQLQTVKEIADHVYKKGIDNIFFAGSGGSITTLMAFVYFFKKYSSIPVYYEEAAELLVSNYKQLTKNSLVVIMAKTGTMIETVELSKFCYERGIPTLGFLIYDGTPVANHVTYKVMIDEVETPARYITLYQFLFRIMYLNGDFNDYDDFMKQLVDLDDVLSETIDRYDELALTFAKDYHQEPFQLFLYSGANYGETLKYSADVAEELFRIPTQQMHVSEFFHGCLEIADNNLCICLLMGEDEARSLDERCLKFLNQYANEKLIVFDPKEIEMKKIKPQYRPLLTPILINLFLCTLTCDYMEEITGMGTNTRRYYGIVDY